MPLGWTNSSKESQLIYTDATQGNGAAVADAIDTTNERLFTLNYISVTIAHFANSLGLTMLMATLPIYIISMGGNKAEAGIVAGAAQLAAIFFRPIMGWLTDAWRRRPLVLMGTSCYGMASIVYLMAHSVPIILIGRVLHGLGLSSYTTAANVYVADIAPANRRAEAMGLFSAAQATGLIIGPVVGFFIIDVADFHTMFYFTGGLATTAFLISLLAREKMQRTTVQRHPWSPRTGIIAPDAIPMAWIVFCMGMGIGSVNAFIAIYGQPRGLDNPGFYFMVQSAALLISRAFTGRLSDRYGRATAIIPGIVFMVIALSMMPMLRGYFLFLTSAAIFGFGFGAAQPSIMALLIDRVRMEQRGLATSTYYIGFDLGLAMGSMLLGMVSQKWGFPVMWPVAAGITLLGLTGLIVNRRREEQP